MYKLLYAGYIIPGFPCALLMLASVWRNLVVNDSQRRCDRPACMFGPVSVFRANLNLRSVSVVGARLKFCLLNGYRRPPCLASSSRRSRKGAERATPTLRSILLAEFPDKARFPSKFIVHCCRHCCNLESFEVS